MKGVWILGITALSLLTLASATAGTLDPRLEVLANGATPAPQAVSMNKKQNPFAPRFDSAGNVQVYILPISLNAPLPSTAELTALGAVKIVPSEALHLVQAWVPVNKLRALAALPDVGRVTVPAYAVPQHATVSAVATTSNRNTGSGSMGLIVLLVLVSLLGSRIYFTDHARFLGNRRSRVTNE